MGKRIDRNSAILTNCFEATFSILLLQKYYILTYNFSKFPRLVERELAPVPAKILASRFSVRFAGSNS